MFASRGARFCRSMKIHFRSFFLGAISLFSFAHYYHCDTMFVYFLSFPTILLAHILLFYVHLFYCRFFLSFSLCSLLVSAQKKVRRQEGTLKCVDEAHTHTRSLIRFYIVENFSANAIVRWKKYECAK